MKRLAETLEILQALWTGEPVDYDGEFFVLRGARQAAVPLDRIPLVIGGAGPKTMALVRRPRRLVEPPHRHPRPVRRDAIAAPATLGCRWSTWWLSCRRRIGARRSPRWPKRFGTMGVVTGDTSELIDYFGTLADRGVERVYARGSPTSLHPATLAAFGDTVIPALA